MANKSNKDLKAEFVQEPLTITKGDKGRATGAKIVTKSSDDEDFFQITAGLEGVEGPLSGFGKHLSGKEQSLLPINEGDSGFAAFEKTQQEPPLDDVIERAVINARNNAPEKIVKAAIKVKVQEIEARYNELPANWRQVTEIRKAVVQVISKETQIDEETVNRFV